ncbi:uncharacterized protein [Danio rerio]|uniref:Uncharacterized protein n=1 Tax=Danio rerio TaxID=7955 RepID=A0AC58HWP2_DANRE
MGPEELVIQFNPICSNILNSVAPLKIKKKKVKPQPWVNSNIRALRQECRRAERKWLKDKLQVSYESLRDCLTTFQRAVKAARSNYLSDIISKNCHNSKVLFSTINTILQPVVSPSISSSVDTCEKFLHFFADKIVGIRAQISPVVRVSTISVAPLKNLASFIPVSLSQLNDIVAHMKPSGSSCDVIPATLFKEAMHSIGPSVLSIVNSSLSTGIVTSSFKHAVIQPLLKKANLDVSDMKNFRKISKLPFISNILEKVVSVQLNEFLANNNIFDKFQSGFRARHSTESALLRWIMTFSLIGLENTQVSRVWP